MNTPSTEGFSTIGTALFISLLLGLGGIGAGGTIAYKQVHPEDFRNQLRAVLGEPLSSILGSTPTSVEASSDTPTPTPTPTPILTDTTPTPTPTPDSSLSPTPTPFQVHIGKGDEDDSSERELEDDQGEHDTGSIGITTGTFIHKRGEHE